jgi:large subunit ribosomal protein L29
MAQSHVAADLRGRSREELNTLVAELKEELFTLRFAAATGQLESHGRLREARKDIARVLHRAPGAQPGHRPRPRRREVRGLNHE